MAGEGEKKPLVEGGGGEGAGWAKVATHLEAAVAAIPKPPYQISDPKELAARVGCLCKQLKPRLKEVMDDGDGLSHRILSLLQDLVHRISDLCKAFYRYVSDKVKRFLKWLSSLLHSLRQRFSSPSCNCCCKSY